MRGWNKVRINQQKGGKQKCSSRSGMLLMVSALTPKKSASVTKGRTEYCASSMTTKGSCDKPKKRWKFASNSWLSESTKPLGGTHTA